MMTIDLAGDISLRRELTPSPEHVFAELSHKVPADIRLGNLEGCFDDPLAEIEFKPEWFHSEPEMAVALRGVFDAMSTANNVYHGKKAILTSNRTLDDLGILHAGSGVNISEARAPVILERKGLRFGMLSYTSVFWPAGHAATERSAGVAPIKAYASYQPHPRALEMPGVPPVIRSWPDDKDLAAAAADVSALRNKVDLVAVYCHWGVGMSETTAEYQQSIGRALIDAGADVVAGGHPHVRQGVEKYKHGVIAYSLGTFFWGRLEADGIWKHMRDGLMVRILVEDLRMVGVNLLLFEQENKPGGLPVLVDPKTEAGMRMAKKLQLLSAPFGTELHISGNDIAVEL